MEFPPLVLYSQDPHNIDVALLSVKADGVEQTVPVKNDKQERVKNIYCHYQLQPKEGAICFRIQLFKKMKENHAPVFHSRCHKRLRTREKLFYLSFVNWSHFIYQVIFNKLVPLRQKK